MAAVRSGEDTADLFASARATYEQGEPQRIGVRFYAMIRRGEPAQLAVEDPDGNLCRTRGPVPEQAVYRSLTPQDLEQQLKKPVERRICAPPSARLWTPI
ncbi:MAG: DUF3656 domain-containing U32 family peptidase [Acutalibacteraceae bacterium]